MTLEDDSQETQTAEITRALKIETKPSFKLPEPVVVQGDEWISWAEDAILKLESNNRTTKLSIMAVGGVALVAMGLAAATGKLVTKLMQGVQALATQQEQMGQLLAPLLPQQGGAIPMPPVPEPQYDIQADPAYVPVQSNTAPKDRSIPDPTVDSSAVVGPVSEGPPGGLGETARALLEADGRVSMKDELPDPLVVEGRHVNPEAKSQAEREAGH